MPDITAAILRHVNDPKYRPAKPKEIAKKLGLENDDVSRFKRTIKQLVKEGQIGLRAKSPGVCCRKKRGVGGQRSTENEHGKIV